MYIRNKKIMRSKNGAYHIRHMCTGISRGLEVFNSEIASKLIISQGIRVVGKDSWKNEKGGEGFFRSWKVSVKLESFTAVGKFSQNLISFT